MATVEASMVLEIANEISGPSYDALVPLKDVLADSSILKAGVGMDLDMLDLYRWDSSKGITDIFGRLDIGGIGSSAGRSASLKNLVKVVLGLDLPKSKKIAMSNWAKAPLANDLIQYAARDAWASAAIMQELCRRDPSSFSISSLLDAMGQEEEQKMEVMDERAAQRKEVKTKLLGITMKDDKRIPRSQLSDEESEEVEELLEKMKELSPPQRILFDIDHLGLSIWAN
jgi:hypothetical protein